jgi:hypothetical protein
MSKHRLHQWEHVDVSNFGGVYVSTWRLVVPGGWLYKVTEWDDEQHYTVKICFVPFFNVKGQYTHDQSVPMNGYAVPKRAEARYKDTPRSKRADDCHEV